MQLILEMIIGQSIYNVLALTYLLETECAVPTSEKFTVQLCALYFRHDVIRLS